MSNYPPGVTGLEPQIVGAASAGTASMEIEHECGFEGEAEGEIETNGYEFWFCYDCPECDENGIKDLPDDYFEAMGI